MANLTVTRTYVGSITNHSQVCDELDSLGIAASKLWNVARWTAERIRAETGETPGAGPLKSYLKNHERYRDLNAQSSQRVIEELAEAYRSWFQTREQNPAASPPGYRKYGETHPRSTVTFKQIGFTHDPEHNRVRLSKGSNLKSHFSDFILCEYETRPDVDLSDVDRIQQVRAVWTHGQWELHFVCKVELSVESTGDSYAGVALGGGNLAAVALPDEYILYPGNSINEDLHYFAQNTQQESPSSVNTSTPDAQGRCKLSRRKTHYYHTLTRSIIDKCASQDVGTLAVTWPQASEYSDPLSHSFERLYQYLRYKAEEYGIDVVKQDFKNITHHCSRCGAGPGPEPDTNGLYICKECGLVGNRECNRAETSRQYLTPNPHTRDRSNGCVAQPSVHLFHERRGVFTPQQSVP